MLLALRLFDGAWRGVGPAWLHRLHRRSGVAVHDTVSLRLRLLCTLAERLVAGLALPARPVLLILLRTLLRLLLLFSRLLLTGLVLLGALLGLLGLLRLLCLLFLNLPLRLLLPLRLFLQGALA